MKILNFGSLNIDYVYTVEHFARTGETIHSKGYMQYCGGKGLNQSVALSYSGAKVYHAGKVGQDGEILIKKLMEAGVDTSLIKTGTGATGHAIIQVNSEGDNCIVLHGGANRCITYNEINEALAIFNQGDYLLLQNEINNIEYIMKEARKRAVKIVLNPAPMNPSVLDYPLDLVDIFIVNELEGRDLSGASDENQILDNLVKRYPDAAFALTLGEKGVRYAHKNIRYSAAADTSVRVADTTAAGDTFTGYFIGSLSMGIEVQRALRIACKACDICVSRQGASSSIPRKEEINSI